MSKAASSQPTQTWALSARMSSNRKRNHIIDAVKQLITDDLEKDRAGATVRAKGKRKAAVVVVEHEKALAAAS